MAIISRRYVQAGPTNEMLERYVAPTSAVSATFPLTIIDITVDDDPSALATADEYMATLGLAPDDTAPVGLAHQLVVATAGAQYTSIKAAVEAAIAAGAGPNDPWLISVAPGTYVEDPFSVIPGITISSINGGFAGDVSCVAADPTNDLITMVGGTLQGLLLRGATSAGKACVRAAGAGVGGYLLNVSFDTCAIGLRVEAGALVGAVSLVASITGLAQEITESVVSVDGPGTQFLANGALFTAPPGLLPFYAVNPIERALSVTNGARADLVASGAVIAPKNNAQTTVFVDSGATASVYSMAFMFGYTAVKIGAGGANSHCIVQGGSFTGHTTNFEILSSTGKIFVQTAVDDENKKAIVAGGLLTGLLQDAATAATELSGNVNYLFSSGTRADIGETIHTLTSSGVVTGGEVTDGLGLTVDIAAGTGWSHYHGPGEAHNYSWAAVAGLALAANATNYVYVDGITLVPTASVAPPPDSAITLAIVVTDGAAIRYRHEGRNLVAYPFQRLFNYLLATRRVATKSGILTSQGTSIIKISLSSGVYYRAVVEIAYAGAVDAAFSYFYNNGTSEVPGQTVLDIVNYDNAGVLTPMTVGFYRADTSYITSDGRVVVVYGTAQYANAQLAEDGGVTNPPPVTVESAFRSGLIIVEQGVGIDHIVDVRSNPGNTAATGGGGGGGVTSHADLTGLAADDHLQYLLVNGGRAMAGNLNMGGQDIVNVGLVEGVDVPAHAARHQPGGIDAISTAAPSTIGLANSEGVAASLARADHVHDHGAQPGGALHDVVTVLTAGFMDAVDKAKLDTVSPGAGPTTPLAVVAPVDVTKAAAAVGVSPDAAREDHKHDVTTGVAVSISTANAEGVAASLARSDHTHEVIFGSRFQGVESLGLSTTNGVGYQQKLLLTTPVIPAGTYIAEWSFVLGNQLAGASSKARVLLDAVTTLSEIEPSNPIASWKNSGAGHAIVVLTNAAHTLAIEYARTSGGTATIQYARLTLWRIS